MKDSFPVHDTAFFRQTGRVLFRYLFDGGLTMSSKPSSLLNSPHLSSRTYHLLSDRLSPQRTDPPLLSAASFTLLQCLCDDILPQQNLLPAEQDIDLAILIEQSLKGPRDGWRFAELPEDQHAWDAGLQTIDGYARAYYGQSYHHIPLEKRGEILDQIHEGTMPHLGSETFLTPEQMALWSGDLRADIVSHFLSHPVIQETLDISAVLTGGDDGLQGFDMSEFEKKK